MRTLATWLLLAAAALTPHLSFALSTEDLVPDEEQKLREEKRDGLNIYRHDLNYFITGQPDTKVQFSFKIQFLHNWDLYFGYTQQMFWDLDKESSPFSDINYNPEVFYRWYLNNGMFKGLDLGAYEHRSNGRDGPESRSWDRSYVTARTEFKLFGVQTHIDTKFFHVYNLDETNLDMSKRLGYVEAIITLKDTLPWVKEDEIQLKLAPGGSLGLDESAGYQELGVKFRLPITRFNPFIYMQVYKGTSESLLHYTEDRTSYRVGLAL